MPTGMRDALSLLDQMISFGDGKVTLDEAIRVGKSDRRLDWFREKTWQQRLKKLCS